MLHQDSVKAVAAEHAHPAHHLRRPLRRGIAATDGHRAERRVNIHDWIEAITLGSLAIVAEMRAHGTRWPWERP